MSYLNCLSTPPMLYLPSYKRREFVHTYDARYLTNAESFHHRRTHLSETVEPAQDNHLYSTWMNDEEIRKYFSIYPTSDTRGKERLEQLYKDGKHIIFGVALNSDNQLIGLVGLKDINNINQSAEFYVIIGDRSAWGKGYGTEATKLMFRYGFMELNLNRIQTKDFEENIGGWRADQKPGMQFEGRVRQSMFRFGKYHDERVYSILRSEFLESL